MKNRDHLEQRNSEIYQAYLSLERQGMEVDEIYYELEHKPFTIKNQRQFLSAERIRKIIYEQRKAEKNRRVQKAS